MAFMFCIECGELVDFVTFANACHERCDECIAKLEEE